MIVITVEYPMLRRIKVKPTIAMMYDFDKTLCDRDMQEYSFMDKIGVTPKEFWGETSILAKNENMDKIIAYMYQMIEHMKKKGIAPTREFLVKTGENVALFKGVPMFFDMINRYGESLGLHVEHYIISSGLKEIISGTEIAKYFKEIFACEFHYNKEGIADFPKSVVNYTTKTQFLFRISKGTMDISDDQAINNAVKDCDRYVQYENMIYLGDGLTDVPCMRLVKGNGGYSIAIYQDKEKIKQLQADNRVDFTCVANFEEGSHLVSVVKTILETMALKAKLNELKKF